MDIGKSQIKLIEGVGWVLAMKGDIDVDLKVKEKIVTVWKNARLVTGEGSILIINY